MLSYLSDLEQWCVYIDLSVTDLLEIGNVELLIKWLTDTLNNFKRYNKNHWENQYL